MLLVVWFHADLGAFTGGFIGVDVFFVLSGFLVTRALQRTRAAAKTTGVGQPLLTFYARRVRRLLPAAALNLVATAYIFRAIAPPAWWHDARRSITAAALYVSNWWFIGESADYFGSDIARSPVAHYWSLSVEEQFYVVWPLLFLGFGLLIRRYATGERARTLLTSVVLGGAAISLVAAFVIGASGVDRAYYGTDTRIYQLLVGAALALGAQRLTSRLERPQLPATIAVVALVGLVLAATPLVDLDPIHRGVLATVLTALFIVGAEASATGPAVGLLSTSWFVYVGRISYGIYLWHWIVILVVHETWTTSPGIVAILATLGAGAAASLSFHLVEDPIRRARVLDRFPAAVIVVGVAMSALVALVAAPAVLDRAETSPSEVRVAPVSGTPNRVDWKAAFKDRWTYDDCPPAPGEACRLASGSGETVMVIGDSHAAMLLPAFIDIAADQDWNLWGGLFAYCPWPDGSRWKVSPEPCDQQAADIYGKELAAIDPDIVILANRPIDDPQNAMVMGTEADPLVGEERVKAFAASVDRTLDRLADGRRKIVIVEPTPVTKATDNPLDCLSEADVLEACRFVASAGVRGEEEIYRAAAADHVGVVTLDLDRATCPYDPICDPVIDGMTVRWDPTHLTKTYAASLAPAIEAALIDRGIIPQR